MSNNEAVVPSTNLDAYYTKPNNMVDFFEDSVAKHASCNLFGIKNKATDKYEWVTYGAVAERVNNLRGALNKLGLSKGEKVGVIVSNSVEWFVCCNATHGLGGVFVPKIPLIPTLLPACRDHQLRSAKRFCRAQTSEPNEISRWHAKNLHPHHRRAAASLSRFARRRRAL